MAKLDFFIRYPDFFRVVLGQDVEGSPIEAAMVRHHYQYALLDLMRRPGTHFPGLAVMDTFPDIAMGAGLRDPLGLVVRPFAELAAQKDIAPVQVILTARDFPATEKVHFVRLTDAWR